MLEPIDVQRLTLVVERCQPRAPRSGEIARYLDARRPRCAQSEHEALELVARDVGVRATHRDVEILIERYLSCLERADRLLVAILKVLRIETELLDGRGPLFTIPPVASEHAADIEQYELDA